MAIKKGFVEVTLSRFKYMSDSMGPQIRTQVVFSKNQLQKTIARPLLSKAAFVYGRGANTLGTLRVYFVNQGLAVSSQGANSDKRTVQNSFGATGPHKKFFEAHIKDVKSVELTAAVYYDDSLDLFFIEVALMPTCYRTEVFQQALQQLPNFGNVGWGYVARSAGGVPQKLDVHKGSLSIPLPATKKVKGKTQVGNYVPPEVREAIQADIAQPQLQVKFDRTGEPQIQEVPQPQPSASINYKEGFLVIREASGSDLWVRREKVNFDVFRVIQGRVQLDIAEGQQVLVDITPQDFLALAAK